MISEEALIITKGDLEVWWAVSAMLVLLMQLGFISLEMGCVRGPSRPGIALKNFTMLIISSLTFTMVGMNLMYGPDVSGIIGWGSPILVMGSYSWFFLQVGFATVAATILSGALAGRTTLYSNATLALVMAVVIYPVYGHWVWGVGGWLKELGAHDFAGSGVVHFIGGFTALIAAKFAGARDGFLDENGKVKGVGSPNYPFATVAVVLLWVGWIGFNGGSVLPADSDGQIDYNFPIGKSIMATCVAACAGGLAAMLIAGAFRFYTGRARDFDFPEAFRQRLLFDPWSTLGGTMGGMVAITANADWLYKVYDTNFLWAALVIGAVGGLAAYMVSYLVKYKLKVDDPVDAVGVHAGAGAVGVLIAGAAPDANLLTQFIMLTAAITWVTIVTVPVVFMLEKYRLFRAPRAEEEVGLIFDAYEAGVYSAESNAKRRLRNARSSSGSKAGGE